MVCCGVRREEGGDHRPSEISAHGDFQYLPDIKTVKISPGGVHDPLRLAAAGGREGHVDGVHLRV